MLCFLLDGWGDGWLVRWALEEEKMRKRSSNWKEGLENEDDVIGC